MSKAKTEKKQLFKQWIKRPSTEIRDKNKTQRNVWIRDKYKTQRNVCYKTIRNAKIAYYDQKTTNIGNSKIFFWILRNLWSKTRQNTYCKLTADDFNDFFSIIGEKLANNFGENLQIKSNRFEKTFVSNPNNEFSTAIKNLKNSKSVGHDGISNITLKQALSVVSQPLTEVFNQCYFEEHYPEALKVARVIQIHKNGSVLDPGNYRPISLLLSIDKVFEKILFNRMMSFLRKNKILSEKQYGFWPKHSCVHALIDFAKKLRKNMDIKLTSQACFIDLSKAFDTIKHERLISKLEFCGFRGKFLNLIRSYLANRYQFVDRCWSEKKMMKYGFPQGSVLGPLLFLIYINDLPENIGDADSVLYAEDTTIFSSK